MQIRLDSWLLKDELLASLLLFCYFAILVGGGGEILASQCNFLFYPVKYTLV